MTDTVLDASALMALLRKEPGAEVVRAALAEAVISAVNYSEVLKKTVERGGSPESTTDFIQGLAIAIIPFDERHDGAVGHLQFAAGDGDLVAGGDFADLVWRDGSWKESVARGEWWIIYELLAERLAGRLRPESVADMISIAPHTWHKANEVLS